MCWRNKPPVCRVALKLLKEAAYTPVPNDKNTGYTLVDDADMVVVLREILASDRYRKLGYGELRSRRISADAQLTNLGMKLG